MNDIEMLLRMVVVSQIAIMMLMWVVIWSIVQVGRRLDKILKALEGGHLEDGAVMRKVYGEDS